MLTPKKAARLLVSSKTNIVKCQLATFEASVLEQINSLSPSQRTEMLAYKEVAEFKVTFCAEVQETTIKMLEKAGWRVKTEPENNCVISVVIPMATIGDFLFKGLE